MIAAQVYAVPTARGTALLVPPTALDALRGAGYVAAAQPARAQVQVHVAHRLNHPALADAATLLARRAAVAATLPAADEAVGPRGRWYATLLIAGWLLLLFSGGGTAQVLGGLWLAVGLPWLRRAYRRRLAARHDVAAGGLRHLAAAPEVVQMEHAGLAKVLAAWEDAGTLPESTPAAADTAAAERCAAAGLPWLGAFYRALAAGEMPATTWGLLPPARAESPAEMQQAPSAAVATHAAGDNGSVKGPSDTPDTPDTPGTPAGAATGATEAPPATPPGAPHRVDDAPARPVSSGAGDRDNRGN